MKKNGLFFALLLLFCCTVGTALGQGGISTTSKKKSDSSFGYRIWYGSHVTLSFSSGFGESLFNFGLAPMAGYKVTPWLSVGPRVYFLYYGYRVNFGGGQVEKVNTSEWGGGVFTRIHPIPSFFAQLEYDFQNEPLINQDLTVDRRTRGAGYVGLGYSSGGGGPWGFEVLLMYNVNQPSNTIESPLDYRAGVTYNF